VGTLDETRLVSFIEAVFSLETDDEKWLQQTLSAPAELLAYRRLAADLIGACRQRHGTLATGPDRDSASPPSDAEEHAEDVVGAAREQLRSAPPLLDAPYTKHKRDAAGNALNLSHPASGTRLTLLHTFEENGRRYVVARENDARSDGVAAFTGREREIVEHATHGFTNKQIACNLGISDATVRVLMARAANRMGVRTRRELLAHPALQKFRPVASAPRLLGSYSERPPGTTAQAAAPLPLTAARVE